MRPIISESQFLPLSIRARKYLLRRAVVKNKVVHEQEPVQYLASSAHFFLIKGNDHNYNYKCWHLKMEFRLSPRSGKSLEMCFVFTHLNPWYRQGKECISPEDRTRFTWQELIFSQFPPNKRNDGDKERLEGNTPNGAVSG